MQLPENQRHITLPRQESRWNMATFLQNIPSFVVALLSIGMTIYSFSIKAHLTMIGSRYDSAMSENRKLINWRPCSFYNSGKYAYLISAYETIRDGNNNILATLKAEEFYDSGEFPMFLGREVQTTLQKPVMFVQVSRGRINFKPGEVYFITITYTYRYDYFFGQRVETKTDSTSTFVLNKTEIKKMQQKMHVEDALRKGVKINLVSPDDL